MRDDPVRWLTPVGPRHEFAPLPADGRLRRPGVATREERRRAARTVLRSVATVAAALAVATLVADAAGSSMATDPLVAWSGALALTALAPALVVRLTRGILGRG